ncbi:MAG: hypothetical protein U5Q03_03130 [Bacteroidota bacterium]|nr:hypothetical protein [Bacteroidota bacterium]
MEYAEIIATAGVGLLLLAFILHSLKLISRDSQSYYILNIIGAGIACYASILIDFIPFVILEAFWALVAIISLIRLYGRTRAHR